MDQTTLTLRMFSTLEQIEKAAQGDPEALKIVCRFAVESVRTDIRQVEDEDVREVLRTGASQLMENLRESKKIQGPLEATTALDKVAEEIAEPIVDALRNTRSLTEPELLFLTSTVDHAVIDAFTGENMAKVRDYIHHPTHTKKEQ